jgi:hypothetical protein
METDGERNMIETHNREQNSKVVCIIGNLFFECFRLREL